MSSDQLEVLEQYPSARCMYHTEMQVFKVYMMVGECSVALSRGYGSQSEAWAEVAEVVRETALPNLKSI